MDSTLQMLDQDNGRNLYDEIIINMLHQIKALLFLDWFRSPLTLEF